MHLHTTRMTTIITLISPKMIPNEHNEPNQQPTCETMFMNQPTTTIKMTITTTKTMTTKTKQKQYYKLIDKHLCL